MKPVIRRRVPLVILSWLTLALALSSCVDTSGPRPPTLEPAERVDEGSGPFNCAADDAYELLLLDDFELGAASGRWYANNELCEKCEDLEGDQLANCRARCERSQSPTIFDNPLPADPLPAEGRCGSTYALHLTAERLVRWGANIGTPLTPPVDGREWEGIAFWARRAPYSRGTVRVEIADAHTDQTDTDETGEPFCNPSVTLDQLPLGCDRFGAYALVGPNWKFFRLPFGEMRPAGWGRRVPYFEIEALRSLTFLFPAGTWDIWIDDVAWYRRRPN